MMKRHKTTHHFLLHILSLLYTDNRYYWHTHTHTHTHGDWMGPIIQPVQKGSSVRFIQVFVSVYVFVWKSVNGLVCVNKWEKTNPQLCHRPQTTRMWHIQLLINSQHVRYLLYLLIDLYKIIHLLALHLLGRETQPSKYIASGQHFL